MTDRKCIYTKKIGDLREIYEKNLICKLVGQCTSDNPKLSCTNLFGTRQDSCKTNVSFINQAVSSSSSNSDNIDC